jgi:lantibiotic modifying enzyme
MEKIITRLRIEQKILEINSVLRPTEAPGLFDGNAGMALYYGYSGKYTGEWGHQELCLQYSQACMEALAENASHFSFSSGFTGICWMFAHLVKEKMLDADSNEYLREIDEPIFSAAEKQFLAGNYDFMHGGLGAALYFLERYPNERAAEYLERIVTLLEGLALRGIDGIKWGSEFPVTENQPAGLKTFNLGLSHGIPSIIRILVYIYEQGIRQVDCQELIEGAIYWILRQKFSHSNNYSSFPTAIIPGMEPLASRTAWCYGDAGIASSLYFAGRALNRPDWMMEGINLMREVANRKNPDITRVKDSCICHGAAGMAHFFHVFNQYEPEKKFKETEQFWADQILLYGAQEGGVAGYQKWQPDSLGGPKSVSGLLEGVSGIALVLKENIPGMRTQWDRCLLIQ